MIKRPVCLLCLIFMAAIGLASLLGVPVIRGPSEEAAIEEYLSDHSQVVRIYGQIYKRTPEGDSVYLKNTYLQTRSNVIPLENVKVYMEENCRFPVGAGVLMSGKLQKIPRPGNPGQFDSVLYYGTQHIFYRMVNARGSVRGAVRISWREILARLRERLIRSLDASAGEYAPVYRAMLLGDKSELEDEVRDRYQMAGILHVLAISGLHLSLIGMGCFRLLTLAGAPIPLSGMLSVFVMFSYGILTGEGVATMRALCMFVLMMGARMLGRTYDLLSALSLSAMLLLVDSPGYLFYSGFLLSFGSICGIALVLPGFRSLSDTGDGTRTRLAPLWRTLTASASVQIATLPVTLYFFFEFPVYGILLNLAAIPALSVVLVSGIAVSLLGMVWLPAAKLAAVPGNLFLAIYDRMGLLAQRLPLGMWVAGQPSLRQIAVYYAILAAVLLFIRCRAKRNPKKKTPAILRASAILLLSAAVVILAYRGKPQLSVTCLDIGQGDCIALSLPSGNHYLVDGGSSNVQDVGRYRILPYLKSQGIRRVSVWISHTDSDHISGIEEMLTLQSQHRTSVKIDRLFLPDWEVRPEEFKELERLAGEAGAAVSYVSAGDALRDGESSWRVLSPDEGAGEDVNESAVVAELVCGEFQGLFTGDIGEETEERLLGVLEDVDFLKVAHHGSRYSTGEAFLARTKPEVSVISASSTNTYGHPHPDTLARLRESGSRVWCTKDAGAVCVTVEDGGMKVETFLD